MYNNSKFTDKFLQFDNVDDEYSDSEDENEDMPSSQYTHSSTPLCSQNSVDSADSGLPSTSSMQTDQSSVIFSTTSSTEQNGSQLACETCGVIAPIIELCPCSHNVCSSCWDLEQIIHIQRVKIKYSTSKRLQEKFSSKVPCIICPKIVKATKQT